MEIQVLLSILAVLTATAVALFYDFVQTRNLQLRESMVEMKVRREEKERKSRLISGPSVHQPATMRTAIAAPEIPVLAAARQALAMESPAARASGKLDWSLKIAPEPATDFSARRSRRPIAAASTTELDGKNEILSPKQALSDWLQQRAIARSGETESTLQKPVPVEKESVAAPLSATEPEPASVAELTAESAPEAASIPEPASEPTLVPEQGPIPETVAEVAVAAEAEPEVIEQVRVEPTIVAPETVEVDVEPRHRFEPVVIDQFLWRSLFNSESEAESDASEMPQTTWQPSAHFCGTASKPAGSAPATSQDDLTIPAGIQTTAVLDQITSANQLFTGLVISVGVSHVDTDGNWNPEVVQSIEDYLVGQLRGNDFACRLDSDEFLLICPDQTGVEAQRFLSLLSERLWDFQLRYLNTGSILFTLGGMDVQREPLTDAIDSAKERMNQTKLSRRTFVMPTPGQRRRTV